MTPGAVGSPAIDCQIHNVGGWHALKGRGSSKTAFTTPLQGVPPSDRYDIFNLRLNKRVLYADDKSDFGR